MERFQGGPRGMNGVLEAPNDLVIVGPCRVKGRRGRPLTSGLGEILGVIEVLFHVASFERCWRYERFDNVGRCRRDKGSKRDVVTTAEGPCIKCREGEPRSTESRRHRPTDIQILDEKVVFRVRDTTEQSGLGSQRIMLLKLKSTHK